MGGVGHERFDHETAAIHQSICDRDETGLLTFGSEQAEERVVRDEDQREWALRHCVDHVAQHGVNVGTAGLCSQPLQHQIARVKAVYLQPGRSEGNRQPSGTDPEFQYWQRAGPARKSAERVDGGGDIADPVIPLVVHVGEGVAVARIVVAPHSPILGHVTARPPPESAKRSPGVARLGQNGAVSQWAGIESDASAAAPLSRAGATAIRTPPPRLRRSERLIVGSIDGAAHVLQRQARAILVGSALLMVPMVAVGVLLAVLAFDRFDTVDGLLGDRGYVGVESGFVFLAVALQSFTAHLIGAYAAVFLVRFQMGGSPRIGECLRTVLRRLPLLTLTWLLTHWWALLFHFWLISSSRSSLAALVWILPLGASLLTTCVLFVTPVMMGEQLGVAAIGRAWRLVRTRFGAAFGFVWACAVLGAMLFGFIAFLPQLAQATGLITFGSYTWLVQGLTAQLALLIVIPFTAIATAQLYLQFRVQAEGLDITLAADRAFGSTP